MKKKIDNTSKKAQQPQKVDKAQSADSASSTQVDKAIKDDKKAPQPQKAEKAQSAASASSTQVDKAIKDDKKAPQPQKVDKTQSAASASSTQVDKAIKDDKKAPQPQKVDKTQSAVSASSTQVDKAIKDDKSAEKTQQTKATTPTKISSEISTAKRDSIDVKGKSEPTQNGTKASDKSVPLQSRAKQDALDITDKSEPKQSDVINMTKKSPPDVQQKKTLDLATDNQPTVASNTPAKAALLIAIIALGLSGFQYYQSQLGESTDQKLASLKQELTAGITQATATANAVKTESASVLAKAGASLAEINANLERVKVADAQKTADIAALQNRLTKSIQQIETARSKQNSRKDWLLAEVEYLLRLANQRVLMEKTPIGALALLESADKILQQTDDVSIFEVRRALAADMAALSGVANVDQEGLYLKIDALSAQINQLKLVPLTDKKQLPKIIDQVASTAVSDAQAKGSTFASTWNKAVSKLEKLVVISHRNRPINPLLSPAQQAGLLQNLHILFEQAQLSLLQGKQATYTRSIEKAEQIVASHFQLKDNAAQALLIGLKALKGERISVEIPSISSSLNTLKAYLKQGAELKSGEEE